MTVLFFILSIICVALTFNVMRPVFRHPKWIVPSFLAGWLVGELAIHVVLVELALVTLFILFGVVKGFWGALGLLAFVGSWLVLSYHYFSGYKAKVLMDSIVIPHRQKKDLSNWNRHRELDVPRLLRPFSSWKHEDVELIKNIDFEQVDQLNLKLDIRCHRSRPANAPILVQIHGGGWMHGYGSKNEQGIPLLVEMAKRGWVTVSISYRLFPKGVFPDPIIDCKKAIIWLKKHIGEYGGNSDFITVTGGSAGGHLSSLLALTPNLPAFQPGFENEDTQVQGCVPFYGIYDLLDAQNLQLSAGIEILMRKKIIQQTKAENPDLYALMSPISHVNKDAPPFLVIHGDKDSLTSLGEAQYFASQLDEVSAQTVEFAEVSGGQHAFDLFSSLRSDYVLYGIAERLEQWYRDANSMASPRQ